MSKSDTKVFNGTEFIFDSDNSNVMTIKPALGKTLNIEGLLVSNQAAGDNKEIQYNDNGVMGASPLLKFDTPYLEIDQIKGKEIHGGVGSDSLGYNEIFNEGQVPQTLVSQFVSRRFSNFGTDVSMAKQANYCAFSCPYYVPSDSDGGVTMWSESSGTWTEYPTAFVNTSFSLDINTKFTATNEDGTINVMSIGDNLGSLVIRERSGSVWNVSDTQFVSYVGVKLAGDISNTILLSYNYSGSIRFFTYNGVNFDTFQILSGIAADVSNTILTLTTTHASIWFSDTLYIYQKNTNWDLVSTETIASVSEIDNYGSIFCYVSNGILYIRENFVQVFTYDVGVGSYTCTNGTYVFTCTSTQSKIRIFHKVSGVWTKSTNDYTLTNCKKMSCNNNYLAVSNPINNRGHMFKIVPYTDQYLFINEIDVFNPDRKVEISSNYGVKIDAPVEITGRLQLNTLSAAQILIGSAGGITNQAVVNGDATLGSNGLLTLANSGVVSGQYYKPDIFVDSKGRITSINNSSFTSSFGIDLTYPSPSILHLSLKTSYGQVEDVYYAFTRSAGYSRYFQFCRCGYNIQVWGSINWTTYRASNAGAPNTGLVSFINNGNLVSPTYFFSPGTQVHVNLTLSVPSGASSYGYGIDTTTTPTHEGFKWWAANPVSNSHLYWHATGINTS